MKIWKSCILAAVFVISGLCADEFIYKTTSLVGIEGGYVSGKVESDNPATPLNNKYNKAHAGLKIGAQGEEFRIFLGINNYFLDQDFDHYFTYGVEVDYMFNFSKYANFFIGANAGMVDASIEDKSLNKNRKFFDPYYGGSAGFNIHVNETFDLELGGRYLSSEATNEKLDPATNKMITYTLDDMVMGYASIIIKYSMD